MVKILAERACAKINLFIRVTGRRDDGYHELDSIFLPISIADEINLEVRTAAESSVTLACNLPALAESRTNLAARAARAFMDEFGLTGQVRIELRKRIPVGAGLGGGSSDAGAILRMLAQLENLKDRNREHKSPADDSVNERLNRIALAIGADVPFFLEPRPSRVTGIGERIVPLKEMPVLPIVIAVPPVEVATAEIFRALRPENWSGAASASDLAAAMRGEISSALTVNDLAAAAIAKFPEIGRLRSMLEELGARAAQMSGSGGAVFGVFDSSGEAERAAIEARRRAPAATIFAATTL
jgi:4-diphosphocytidyl-2-C-methyl-D-erythritol kinase